MGQANRNHDEIDSSDESIYNLIRRIRRLEEFSERLTQVTNKVYGLEEDLHNRARAIETRVKKLEDLLLGRTSL